MSDIIAQLAYLAVLIVAIGGWFLASNRSSISKTLQMALVWGMIFMGGMAIYGLWTDIIEAAVPRISLNSKGGIEVPRSRNGHYHLTVEINDVDIKFLVDTGATDLFLTQEDAKRVGINIKNLAYIATAYTANGPVKIAHTKLKKVKLGEFVDLQVNASINGGEMQQSLLGMSYLSNYDKIEISENTLILYR
jgi:aspartyl protease family protein